MAQTKSTATLNHIETAREKLRSMGGKFWERYGDEDRGLERWLVNGYVVFLHIYGADDGFDVYLPATKRNDLKATWQAVEEFCFSQEDELKPSLTK